jgi:site-specific DNA-methyltransferase (adenine-specific)
VEASTIYDDAPEKADELLRALLPQIKRTLRNDRHCYIMGAMSRYKETLELISQYLDVDPIPLLWDHGRPSHASTGRRWPACYVPIFFCWKGQRDLVGASHNVIQVPPVPSRERIHPHQKPIELYQQLIAASTFEGEIICDPCCGSGVAAIAAARLKRKSICIDLNPETVEAAKSVLRLKMEAPQ